MKQFFYYSLVAIFMFTVGGELIRLPIGPEILPNDALVGIIAAIWIIQKTFMERKWPKSSLWIPFFTFIALAIISLVNGSRELTTGELFSSSLYLIRFIEYFFLIFIAYDLARDPAYKHRVFSLILFSAVLLTIFGFLQLKYYPDFTELQDLGWDPHINRLLSTWFDPNFLGGMLAFVLCLVLGRLLANPKEFKGNKGWAFIGGILLLVGLLLTYSRSAYLAFMAGVVIIGVFKSRKLLIIAIIAGLLLVSVSSRAQERVSDLYHSATSLISDTAELPDATARLRIDSWKNAITIIKDHPWFGVGYNAYAFIQSKYGFVKTLNKHSATGSDSTLLTIFATTGIFGLITYISILLTILWAGFKEHENPLVVGFLAGTAGLLVHSVFVNSLLYTPLLIFFYTATGWTLAPLRPQIKHHTRR